MYDTDEDSLSTTSSGSSLDLTIIQEFDDEQDGANVLEGYMDALFEKRASVREAGLKGLVNALKTSVLVDFVVAKYETIAFSCTTSVKRGSSAEISLASHILGLLVLTAGAGDISQRVMNDASPHLTKVVKRSSSPSSRIAAMEALAILSFVGGSDLEVTESTMSTLWQICSHKGNYHADQTLGANPPSGAVRAAALSAWAFLLSTVPSRYVATHHIELTLPTLSGLLRGDDLSTRTAAGEAVALLYETTKSIIEHSPESEHMIAENQFLCPSVPQSIHKLAMSGRKALETKEAEVLEQMKALSLHTGGKGQSKKGRYMQRASFRDLLSTIEDGACREISVKLKHGDALKISTWTQAIQLNVLRHFLGEGFQKHLQENMLLHEIFDFIPQAEKRRTLSTKEKRIFMSPNSVISKCRTQTRNRLRSIAQAGNEGHFNVNLADEE